jgi:hypothetical protein
LEVGRAGAGINISTQIKKQGRFGKTGILDPKKSPVIRQVVNENN